MAVDVVESPVIEIDERTTSKGETSVRVSSDALEDAIYSAGHCLVQWVISV